MRAVAVVCVAFAVGCLEPAGIQHCGDTICPATLTCVDDVRCVDSAAISVCDSLAVGDSCELAGVFGRCVQHSNAVVCDAATCGDDVIDEPLKEVCDGSASFASQCVDLSYDLGRLGCADDCEFDVSQCRRFGWELVINELVQAMWTDGDVMAYASSNPSRLRVTGGGFDVDEPGTFSRVTGGGGRIVAVGDSLYEAIGTGIVKHAAPVSDPDDILVTDTGRIYAISSCPGAVAVLTYQDPGGAWQRFGGSGGTVPCAPGIKSMLSVGPQGQLYLARGNAVDRVTPPSTRSQWCPPTGTYQTAIRDFASRRLDGREYVYLAVDGQLGPGSVIELDPGKPGCASNGNVIQPIEAFASTFAFTDSSVFVASAASGRAQRRNGPIVDELRPPAGLITDDGLGHIYAFGGPVYRFSGYTFGELPPPSLALDDPVHSKLEVGPFVLFASRTTMLSPQTSSWALANPTGMPTPIRALGGVATAQYVMSAYPDSGSATPTGIWYVDLAGATPLTPDPPGTPVPRIDGLLMISDVTTTVFAVGKRGTHGFLGSWVSPTPPTNGVWSSAFDAGDNCSVRAVAGSTNVVAVGGCNNEARLWRYNPATTAKWEELKTFPELSLPFDDVLVLGSQIFAVGEAGTAWTLDGQTWTVDASVAGTSISGSTGDVWIAGAFTPIQQWDGNQWSKMTTRSLTPTVISASPERVLMPGGAAGHVSLIREATQ